MSMMTSIASGATNLSASRLSLDYATSMTKKAMDTQEMIAQNLLQMLPAQPPKGNFIDVYA